MIIDKRLNLVIPIERDDQTVLYIHATPLPPAVFEQYYLVLAKAFSQLTNNGLSPTSGPSVAAMLLADVAKSTIRSAGFNGEPPTTWWEGDDGVGGKAGLMAGMQRLSNVLVPGEKGWEVKPLADAKDMLSEEERSEVSNAITFFTVVSLVASRTIRRAWLEGLAALYGLLLTSSDCTVYASSLPMPTTDANTGEKAPA